ncbi:MAG TPA: RNA methyltransferase [Streptosporangiaceae bacterium]|nr:RNA methyltransferase [Streptosporangiaceae bacterium]
MDTPPGHASGHTYGVARIIGVADPDDERLADYVRLRDVNLRRSLEAERGLFIAEGEKVIRRAVTAGYPVRSVLVTGRHLAGLADVADACGAPVYVVSDQVAERLTGFEVHRGALACCLRLPLPSVAEVTRDARRIIVLEDLVDHGNVGGIFRCAAAFGVNAVILSPRCADPLYRRAVKVSMGAVFAIPYARLTGWRDGLARLRADGFTLLALTPDQAAQPIGKVPMGERAAIMLGAEGDGLSSHWLEEAGHAVCIPMSRAAMAKGVDSLNVVAAAAVVCHSLMSAPACRQR